MKLYITTCYDPKQGWLNQTFHRQHDAIVQAREWTGEAVVHLFTFRGNAVGVAAFVNGAHFNPMNFCEIEGLEGLEQVFKSAAPKESPA